MAVIVLPKLLLKFTYSVYTRRLYALLSVTKYDKEHSNENIERLATMDLKASQRGIVLSENIHSFIRGKYSKNCLCNKGVKLYHFGLILSQQNILRITLNKHLAI